MENKDIRILMVKKDITFTQLAKELNVDRASLSRLFRYPLSDRKREEVVKAIESIGLSNGRC